MCTCCPLSLTQATASEYSKFEAGNELSYAQLDKYLTEASGGARGWYSDIVPQMHAIIRLCFDAVRDKLAPVDEVGCPSVDRLI